MKKIDTFHDIPVSLQLVIDTLIRLRCCRPGPLMSVIQSPDEDHSLTLSTEENLQGRLSESEVPFQKYYFFNNIFIQPNRLGNEMKIFAFPIALIFFSTACQFIPEDKVDTRKVRKFPMEVPLPVSLSMELNTTEIARGDSVEITLTFQNYSDSTVDVMFGWDTHYGYHFDFMVTSLDSMLVWHRMAEITFQGGVEFSFRSGDKVEYPGKWGTNYDDSHHQVFKGPYLIWGELDGFFGVDSTGRDAIGISTEAQLIHVK